MKGISIFMYRELRVDSGCVTCGSQFWQKYKTLIYVVARRLAQLLCHTAKLFNVVVLST